RAHAFNPHVVKLFDRRPDFRLPGVDRHLEAVAVDRFAGASALLNDAGGFPGRLFRDQRLANDVSCIKHHFASSWVWRPLLAACTVARAMYASNAERSASR